MWEEGGEESGEVADIARVGHRQVNGADAVGRTPYGVPIDRLSRKDAT